MNFTELYTKIRAIDENLTVHPNPSGASSPEEAKRLGAMEPQQPPVAPKNTDTPPTEESMISLGGPMPSGMMGMPHKQEDSVTMNVSMNGSGAGGIKDLMDIIRSIEAGDQHHDAVVSAPHPIDGEFDIELDEQHGDKIDADKNDRVRNRPHRVTYGVDAITKHGTDMHSKGDVKRLKVNGGENPLQEALINKLSELYQEVKSREVDESAKWRDPKYKDKLYTQNPDDDDDHVDYYHDSRPDNDPGQKHSTFDRDKNTDKLHFPYGDYQVGQKAQVGDRAKKGLLTKNAIRVVKNRINATHGDHPTPKLPK